MNQKGFIPVIWLVVFLLALTGAYYLGNRNSATSIPSLSPTPKLVSSTASPIPIKPSGSVAATPTAFDLDNYFRSLFPSDIPVYPGAKMVDYINQGKCMQELLNKDPNCLQVMFVFKVEDSETVEKIVNWYVANPNSGWTYRGVYGDQRDYQFGDLYKNDIYYRLIYRYLDPNKSEIEIDYNGPYPISNLSPRP
jgi:hypothetical protein